jgi:hypothetical protein
MREQGLLDRLGSFYQLFDPNTGNKRLSFARRPDQTVSSYFFAVNMPLTISSGNMAVYVSYASSRQ